MTDPGPLSVAALALQGGAFAVWAVLAFRTLFRLRTRAVAASGTAFPGLGATLASFTAFWREAGHAADRRAMGLASGALVATMILSRWLMGG